MKKVLFTLLLLAVFAKVFAQFDEYPSREEDAYHEKLRKNTDTSRFKIPVDFSIILNFHSKCYTIKEYNDNISNSLKKGSFTSLGLRVNSIGKIKRSDILKYGKRGKVEAFISKSFHYGNHHDAVPGIWIGYSKNKGKDWGYYYTGIVQKHPVFIEPHSSRPLIGQDGKLRIDAKLMRQLTPMAAPIMFPTYACMKDNIYVVFDMDVISKDSDNDGLTDLMEDLFSTDKYNRDTDGDGIPDNRDTNPRKHPLRTEKTKVLEAIFNNSVEKSDSSHWRKLILQDHPSYSAIPSTKTVVVYTDDRNLMGICPKKKRIIFISSKHAGKRRGFFYSGLKHESVSPLFKVDGKKDTYKITIGDYLGGGAYLVKKTKDGWFIQWLYGWIV